MGGRVGLGYIPHDLVYKPKQCQTLYKRNGGECVNLKSVTLRVGVGVA